jgi:hypothetical protein
MCFHIGPEFVEALQSKPADRSHPYTPIEAPDDAHASMRQKQPTPCRNIVSRLRSIFLGVITIKWILFILWACF